MVFSDWCPRTEGRAKMLGFIGGMMLAASAWALADAGVGPSTKSSAELARLAAEITQRINDENKRPFKTYITPRTTSVVHAFYYKQVQKRIEEIGTESFPTRGGKKLYGELIVLIPIYQDGSLFLQDGGPRVEKSSGNGDLDSAALDIIRSAAPFDPFPEKAISVYRDDLWVIIAPFTFKREEMPPVDTSSTGSKPSGAQSKD